jgi:hypothetical protein
MKDVYQVLRQKEMDLARVRREIEELRSIIPSLADHSAEPMEATGESSLTSGVQTNGSSSPTRGPLDSLGRAML